MPNDDLEVADLLIKAAAGHDVEQQLVQAINRRR
jgi:hypothetical protein